MTTAFYSLFGSYNQAYFLDMFDHIFPDWYLGPLKSPGPGYELVQAYSSVGERLGMAANRIDDCAYILSAPLGAKATVLLSLSRPTATAGAVTVQKGSVFTSSRFGCNFITTDDVLFTATGAASDLTPAAVLAEAENVGYEYNVRGQRTTAAGATLDGEIDTVTSLYEDPPYGDSTIVVTQVPDATGGTPAALEQHGADRGVIYHAGEYRTQFISRVYAIPDTVSLDALKRAIAALFDPLGISPQLIETWEPAYQGAFDSPRLSMLFVYDDPRPEPPGRYQNRWFDEIDYRAAFFAVVPNLAPMAEFGLVYDDTGVVPADFVNTLGARAESAYDVPVAMPTGILIGSYDGIDVKKAALFAGLYETLQNIKAGGVFATVELEGQ